MIEELVKRYQVSHDKKILEEIIRLNKDIIDFYLNNIPGLSYEERYDYIIEGLIKAVLNYKFRWKSFASYADSYIKNTLVTKINQDKRNGGKLFADFLVIKRIIENRYGVTLEKDFSIFDDILEEMLERGLIDKNNFEKEKKIILVVLRDYQKCLNKEESIDYSDIPFDLDFDIPNLKDLLITILGERKYLMLAYQYGLFGLPKLTQREIGEKFNLNQATIYSHNVNSLKKIQTYFNNINNKYGEGKYYA